MTENTNLVKVKPNEYSESTVFTILILDFEHAL